MAVNMDIILAEWRARSLAEYRSAALGAEFLAWLLRQGFASDTLQLAQRFVANELDHADMSFEIYAELGGDDDPTSIQEGTLVIPHGFGGSCIERTVLACLDLYCIGETLATPLFTAMADATTESGPRQLLERIVADSETQGALGWAVLAELMERDSKLVTRLAKEQLPNYLSRVERAWGLLPEDWIEPVGPGELRYGLIPRARYKREFYQCIAEEVLPRLDASKLPGRPSWGKRPKNKT
ncbi:MAG: hypothetical protein CMP23_00055 [Rickettsiales bacterium]|nr:hypothetical protein [Rickettsiales bacterium]